MLVEHRQNGVKKGRFLLDHFVVATVEVLEEGKPEGDDRSLDRVLVQVENCSQSDLVFGLLKTEAEELVARIESLILDAPSFVEECPACPGEEGYMEEIA